VEKVAASLRKVTGVEAAAPPVQVRLEPGAARLRVVCLRWVRGTMSVVAEEAVPTVIPPQRDERNGVVRVEVPADKKATLSFREEAAFMAAEVADLALLWVTPEVWR
jgi:hypothetical protein